jgi:hypothetical protein
MNRISAFLLLACFTIGFAQAQQIKSGATVYIEPMGGFETDLAAAILKKHVPLIVVADEDKADYIIQSTVTHTQPAQAAVVVNNSNVNNTTTNSANVNNGSNDAWAQSQQRAAARAAARAALGSTSANISVKDAHSSQIIFAYSVGKAGTTHEVQSAAEACAKHLKEFIEKPK